MNTLRDDIEAQICLGDVLICICTGLEVLREAGGIHGFNGWKGPVLTDSGGFQVIRSPTGEK